MRILALFLTMILVSCGGGGGGASAPASGASTSVTISLGQVVATGGLSAVGVIPAGVKSMGVEAFDSQGTKIAGPVYANAPNFTVTIAVPNGTGIVLQVKAFSGADGTGTLLYFAKSASQNLTGAPVTVPVTMSLAIGITATPANIYRNSTVTLTGTVAGQTPPQTSPLLWSASAGVLGTPASLGASVSWQAPNTVGAYKITARIDPQLNPDQVETGTMTLNVVNRAPTVSFSSATITLAQLAKVAVQVTASDPDGDTVTRSLGAGAPAWATMDATGLMTLAPGSSIAAGAYSVPVVATDALGLATSKTLTVNVNANTTPLAFSVVDGTTNLGVSGVEVWLYNMSNLALDRLGVTNSNGLIFATIPANTNYAVAVDTKSQPYASGYWTSTVLNNSNLTLTSDARTYTTTMGAQTLKLASGKTISGSVTSSSGAAVPNAKVSYSLGYNGNSSFWTHADTNGNFVTGVAAGQYKLFAEGVSYVSASSKEVPASNGDAGGWLVSPGPQVVVNSSQATLFDLRTSNVTGANAKLLGGTPISGSLTDVNGAAVANVNIMVEIDPTNGVSTRSSTTKTNYSVTTDSTGAYSINLPAGYYMLYVENGVFSISSNHLQPFSTGQVGGYASSLAGGTLVASFSSFDGKVLTTTAGGTAQTVNMKLLQGGTLSGTVSDSFGVVSSVRVQATNTASSLEHPLVITTSSQGTYTLNVPAGSYHVNVEGFYWNGSKDVPLPNSSAGGYATSNNGTVTNVSASYGSFTVSAGTAQTLNMTLPTGGTISGVVYDPSGAVVSGVEVRPELSGANQGVPMQSNYDGSYGMNVIAGTYVVNVPGLINGSSTDWPSGWKSGYIGTAGTLLPSGNAGIRQFSVTAGSATGSVTAQL